MHRFRTTGLLFAVVVTTSALAQPKGPVERLPGTDPLTWDDDIAARMVDGMDRFLLRELSACVAKRDRFWQRDVSSVEAYEKSIEPNRKRLAHILGVRDARVPYDAPELVATTQRPALIGTGEGYEVFAVRWPVLAHPQPGGDSIVSIHGEGLLLLPTDGQPLADIVAVPDADQTPEQAVGLAAGIDPPSQFARRLAECQCRVLVPTIISREMKKRNGRANLTHREYLYRPAFELGRHLIGYEVQKILAGVDWFERSGQLGNPDTKSRQRRIGIIGYGEGGMLALYAGALDRRIDVTCVLGFFGPREAMWQEPIDRNVFGLLDQFGAAELATMILPRTLCVEDSVTPAVDLPGEGGAPARIARPDPMAVQAECERAEKLVPTIGGERAPALQLTNSPVGSQRLVGGSTLRQFVARLRPACKQPPQGQTTMPEPALPPLAPDGRRPQWQGPPTDAAARQQRQVEEIDRHNQLLLAESSYVRQEFMGKLDTSSVEAYEKSAAPYRQVFRSEVLGCFDQELLAPRPRTRQKWANDQWTGYEVVLDVWPDVIAYGVLLLPKDLPTDGSEKRPVVVCQHGLEGRPTDTFLHDHGAYHDFAATLAERGFITFAPQNPYIFGDRFRTLQRKANPLGKTLFSIIVPQHQQIVDWLQTLPYVDPKRIGFYGLSYGGKTAMRVPALVTDYCLAICSADFNEWVRKNASTRLPFSYVWTGEYEIFEFDLGSTFNYAEMAALICPRPFMVERGHFDGVGWDEWVAYEFAKVRHLYQAQLGIGERTEIEWFAGPHTINGQGTYEFLHKHLRWPN